MSLYDNVITSLKGVVGSRKDGVLLRYLDSDYRSMTGEYFPFKNLGYDSLYEFLRSNNKLFALEGDGRFCRVFNNVGKIENDSTLSLISLIQHTQPKIRTNDNQTANQYAPQHLKRPMSVLSWFDVRTNSVDFVRYQHPQLGYLPDKISESYCRKLLVPTKCLLIHKTQNTKDVLNSNSIQRPNLIEMSEVATQTFIMNSKTPNNSSFTFYSLEFCDIIIDLIIESKFVNFNEVLSIRIMDDLYHNFRFFTGLNVEPGLFNDYVINSIESYKNSSNYNGIIDLDTSRGNCIFNTKRISYSNAYLPDYDFNFSDEYIVDIVRIFHNNLIAFKVTKKLNSSLIWHQTVIDDRTKSLIQNQYFWSWIPGSICLVQFPQSLVKKLNIANVERAVIISTEIVTTTNTALRKIDRYLIHRSSFYLIDHDIEVEEVLSCASSFQNVKQNAKRENDTDLAQVCNMSWSARNTPSKILFTIIENYKDISDDIRDNCKNMKPIILKNIRKMKYIFHFQFVYSCFAKLYCDLDDKQPLNECNDIKKYDKLFLDNSMECNSNRIDICQEKPFQNEICDSFKNIEIHQKEVVTNCIEKEYSTCKASNESGENDNKTNHFRDNILISFSKNEPRSVGTFCATDIKDDSTNSSGITVLPDVIEKKSQMNNSHNVKNIHEEIIVISDSEEDSSNLNANEQSYSCQIVASANINEVQSHSIKIDLTNISNLSHDSNTLSESPNGNMVNGISCTSYKINNDKISVVSYSDNEYDSESFDDIADKTFCSNDQRNISLPNSIISYLENNSNPPRKCLRPLTIDISNNFHGKIVKLLHVQMGSAVIMLFDSVKLIRREIKMTSLKKQILPKVEKVLVGDFFIWRKPNNDVHYLVEIMQIVSKISILVNIVHQGLLAVININEMFSLPKYVDCSLVSLIGPTVGAFDLHMFPDWFTPDESINFSDHLFTAFFAEDGKLILEYLERPCNFFNIEMIDIIERSLMCNHCNIKSANFIEMLTKSLIQCKLFVGNLLEMIEYIDETFEDLSITKVLSRGSLENKKEILFASIMVKGDESGYEKLSPHNFATDQFCIDRVIFDERKQCLRLLDYQNVYVDIPDNCEGLYRIDRTHIRGSLLGSEEFLTRYMLAIATGIPDLKYLYNKLIFDIHF